MNGDLKLYNSSEEALTDLSQRFGSAVFTEWQTVRKKFYSYASYLEAGAVSFNFFNASVGTGGLTIQDTNLPKPGSFGQVHFLLKSIQTRFFITTWDLQAWAGTDASTLYSDLIAGFTHGGVMNIILNNRIFAQIPKPFLYCPPGDGQERVHSAGLDTLTLTEGTPNVILTSISHSPYATLNSRPKGNIYVMDPQIMIEAEQNMTVSIEYPSGAIPVIGTGVTDDTTNPLKIGVIFDGILFRPLQ